MATNLFNSDRPRIRLTEIWHFGQLDILAKRRLGSNPAKITVLVQLPIVSSGHYTSSEVFGGLIFAVHCLSSTSSIIAKTSWVPRFEAGTAGCVARKLPLCSAVYAVPPRLLLMAGGLHSIKVSYLLLTQQPTVQFLDFFSWCCWYLLTALLRKVDRGLIMSSEPI